MYRHTQLPCSKAPGKRLSNCGLQRAVLRLGIENLADCTVINLQMNLTCTLAVLNIEPPEQKIGGSIADDPINLAHLLGMLHIVDLIC
jgi:hypothetical protein